MGYTRLLKDLTQSNYKPPLLHPGLYYISQVNKIPKANAMFFPNKNKKKHKLDKVLRQLAFDDIIEDNIDDYNIKKQMKSDVNFFGPVNIIKNRSSL